MSKGGKRPRGLDFLRLRQRELAAIHGIDERTLRRWDDSGHPRNPDGTYSAPASIEWRIAHELGTTRDLDQERARLAAAQADKVEMENAVRRGELIYAQHVRDTWGVIFANIKAGMLALPARVAPLVEERVRGRVFELIDARVRELLEELADSDPVGEYPPDDDAEGNGSGHVS